MAITTPDDGEKHSPETASTVRRENLVQASVELTLNGLTDDELAAFNNLVGWGDKDLKKATEKFPWFSKVEPLFTADGGKNLHPDTARALTKAVVRRLMK